MLVKAALFFHIVAAILWIGGMLFISLIIAPFLLTMPDPKERSKIYQVVGKKYRLWGWAAIITLLVTGPVILFNFYGVYPQAVFSHAFNSTPVGRALTIKLTLVAIIVISSFVHDFWLGPKARNSPHFSLIAKIFGRSNLIVALFIVIFAVILRAGGF
ncbi:MAG: DUF4149 domain-containing protein [Thermodesulfobacteriota bacterium]